MKPKKYTLGDIFGRVIFTLFLLCAFTDLVVWAMDGWNLWHANYGHTCSLSDREYTDYGNGDYHSQNLHYFSGTPITIYTNTATGSVEDDVSCQVDN